MLSHQYILEQQNKSELVTSLERRFINLSNSVKIMDLSHTQPKLVDAEHASGRKFQTEKSTLEVSSDVRTRFSTWSFQNQPFCFCYFI